MSEPVSDRNVITLPDLDATVPSQDCIELPDIAADDEEAVAAVIAQSQRILFKHPVAAQALYRALVAEGRQFATTSEGSAWRARLEASPAIRRLRPLWEAATFNVLEATGDSQLPSKLVELVAQALSHADMEATTAFLSERTVNQSDGELRRR